MSRFDQLPWQPFDRLELSRFGRVTEGADVSRALAAALEAAHEFPRAEVVLPPGRFYLSEPAYWTRPVGLRGTGDRHTILVATGDIAGDYAMHFVGLDRNGAEQHSDDSYDYDADRAGLILRDFAIVGDRTEGNVGGIVFDDETDCVHLERVLLAYLTGCALDFAGTDESYVRESTFDVLSVVSCGDADAGVPCVNVDLGATAGASDGTNHVTFNDARILYNRGPFRIGNTSTTEVLRRIILDKPMLHGDHAAATDPACDVVLIEGRVQDVEIANGKGNGSHDVGGTKYALVRVRAAGGYTPMRVQLTAWDQNSCSGHGIVVEDCDDLTVTGHSSPSTIAGDEIQLPAGSVNQAYVRLLSRTGTARTLNIDATVIDKVAGLVDDNRYTFPELDVAGDLHVAGQVLLDKGVAAAPGVAFTDDPDTGFLLVSAGVLAAYVAASRVASFEAALLRLNDGTNIATGTGTGLKIGTATGQKIGFHNATPTAQQTTAAAAAAFVANTSGIANDSATFDGYTIGQAIKALRTKGFLA